MRYLVDFKHDVTDEQIQNYLASNGCQILKEWDNFDKVFLVECTATPSQSEIIERLVQESPLELKPLLLVDGDIDCYVGSHDNPNLPTITINTTDDKDWWKNYTYYSPKFDVPEYTINRKGKGIVVYLMDSGIETSHPEFAESTIENLYTVTPGDYSDNNGHGTALASVIVGSTCGISNATIKNVKIYDANHELLQSELLSALDAIINDHAENTVAILNCSWVIPKNEYVEHKLRILWDEGIHILAAAGNQGTTIEDVTPASMFEALTTGAYNKDLLPCDFSNYSGGSIISVTENATNSGELDGWAPGELIYSAGLNGTYGYTAGTSIATAIATAVCVVNLGDLIDENGILQPPLGTMSISSLDPTGVSYIFIKRDLLDLSDPKYSNTINIIAGLHDKANDLGKQTPDDIICAVRVDPAGIEKVIAQLFSPRMTKKIEWVQKLPSIFHLNMLGKLSVDPALLSNPNNGETYITYTGTFNRTNIDDTVELVTIKVFVLPENLDPSTIPADHPVALLLQTDSLCDGLGGCSTSRTIYGCFQSCPGSNFCCDYCGFKSGFFFCNCANQCP